MTDARDPVAGFEDKRIVTEGFVGPQVNQGLPSSIRYLNGNSGVLSNVRDVTDKVLAVSDRAVFNRLLPKGMRAMLEIGGRKTLSSQPE